LVERPPQTGRQHTVLNNLGILTPLRLPTLSTQVTMAYEAGAAAYWQEARQQRELKDYVVVQPTARWAFKTWSAEGFSQLLDHLSARGQRVVLTGGPAPEEKAMIEAILTGCRYENRVVNLAGRLSLTQLAVFIERAKLFVGVDSAPMHMAAALGTPIVALFGPSNLAQWYPWQTPHTMLWAGRYRALPPVHQVNTATADRYLHAIPASAVIKAVDAWLDDPARMLREYADNPPRYAGWQEWRQADNI
jgi:heptosyltransferase-3